MEDKAFLTHSDILGPFQSGSDEKKRREADVTVECHIGLVV